MQMEKIETVEKVLFSRTLVELDNNLERLTKMLDYEKVKNCCMLKEFQPLNPSEENHEILLGEACMHYSNPSNYRKEGMVSMVYVVGYIPTGSVSEFVLPGLQIVDNTHKFWGYGKPWDSINPGAKRYFMDCEGASILKLPKTGLVEIDEADILRALTKKK